MKQFRFPQSEYCPVRFPKPMVKENSDEKLDITYFAIPAGSFLEPEVFEGHNLDLTLDAALYNFLL